MKKAARTTGRALISRAQQIFSIRRRLALLRELERRLKERAAVLDAYKPARRSPSPAVCSSYHASSASQRLAATGPLTGEGMRAAPSPDRSQATSPWAQRPIDSIPADIHNPVVALAPEASQGQRSGAPVSGKAAKKAAKSPQRGTRWRRSDLIRPERALKGGSNATRARVPRGR